MLIDIGSNRKWLLAVVDLIPAEIPGNAAVAQQRRMNRVAGGPSTWQSVNRHIARTTLYMRYQVVGVEQGGRSR